MTSTRASESSASEFFPLHAVYLNLYDMSNGYAKVISPLVLGQRMAGVWHTGVEVFGKEYFYGGGIYKIQPGEISMKLAEKRFLGTTSLCKDEFERFLVELKPLFNDSTYNLLSWNCNHFSDMLARYLVGKGLEPEIVDVGAKVQKSFVGRCLANCFLPPVV